MNKDLKIMIIDDEKPIVDTLKIYFSRIGYEPVGHYDSRLALEELKNNEYDIVFTDLKMPDVSGMEIVKYLKESEAETIVIIFTGYATTDSAIEAIQFGVYDYIRKPFKLDEIRVVLNRAVEKLYLRRENIALTKKIEKMLSQVTMLSDITTILYQVHKFSEVSEMILDTITEGIGLKYTGIMTLNSKKEFVINKHRNLSEEFVKTFTFASQDKLNHFDIKKEEIIILPDLKTSQLKINDRVITIPDYEEMLLIPIRFMNKLFGYIIGFDPVDEIFPKEDIIKLLDILSVHIAPIFQNEKFDTSDFSFVKRSSDQLLLDVTSKEIDFAKNQGRSVTFVLYKLENNNILPSNINIEKLGQKFKSILQSEYEQKSDILQQYFDTILVIIPGGKALDVEFSTINIKKDIEQLYLDDNNQPILTMNYAYSSVDKNFDATAHKILNDLYISLYNQTVNGKD